MGVSNEGAYYVSTFYPTSASRLIKGKTKLGADDFHELTSAVLAGLVELRECCRRSQGDLAGLGRVLYELVMHKPYNVAGAWPIPDSPEWARMGKRGKGWKEFCNKLLSTDPADATT